jgi:hypothetical protein
MGIGSKGCEFLAKEHLEPHTEVSNEEGLRWPKLLAKQEEQDSNDRYTKAAEHYERARKQTCERYSPAHNGPCPGKPVIRVLSSEKDINKRLFVGCDHWNYREKGHMFIDCRNLDPVAVLRIWGKENCWVPDDFLEKLEFTWDDVEGITIEKLNWLTHEFRRAMWSYLSCGLRQSSGFKK